MRTTVLTALVLGGLSVNAVSTTAIAQVVPLRPVTCDRACLEGYIDKYLTAMLNKDVSDELFARSVRFTENGIELPLGNEGLWYGMSGTEGYKFYVPDIETQQVAFIGTVKENMANGGQNDNQGNNIAVAIRLKIVDSKITEVEQLAIRPEVQLGGGRGGGAGARAGGAGAGGAAPGARLGGPAAPGGAGAARAGGPGAAPGGAAPGGAAPGGAAAAGGRGGAGGGGAGGFGNTGDNVLRMGQPHEMYRQPIPVNERHTREELVQVGNAYFTALARHDSKGYYPFTTDCVRFENGITATSDCLTQFTGTSLNNIVDRIRDRRFVAVDVERGIAFSFAFFDHYRINWTWQLAELFRIENGKIRRIEAVFHQAPFGISSGWSPYELAISEELQSIR